MASIVIRSETPEDYDAVREIHLQAFGEASPGRLADDLRVSGHAAISLVAEQDGLITGHILFSRLSAPMRALTLAPLGIHPAFQKSGLGSALIKEGLMRARQEEWQAVFVLGSPLYYERFNFSAAAAQGYTSPYKGPSNMAQLFDAAAPRVGSIIFPLAFEEDIRKNQARYSEPISSSDKPNFK